MTFLSPIPALIAAGVALPLLILLYLLKLRRRTLRVPSTMLWEESRKDLEANEPFQRLRLNLLFLLQALVLALVLLALARPLAGPGAGPSGATVIIIDASASMSARANAQGATRLDRARELAHRIVSESTREPGWQSWFGDDGGGGTCAVVESGSTARLRCGLTDNRAALDAAVDAVDAGDEEGRLGPALQLAESVAAGMSSGSSGGGGGGGGSGAGVGGATRVIIISDGRYPDEGVLTFRGPKPEFLQVIDDDSAPSRNAGVTALSARWSNSGDTATEPGGVDVFARLIECGIEGSATAVRVDVNGTALQAKAVKFAPSENGISEASVNFRVPAQAGDVIRVTQTTQDDLAADDSAALVLAPRQPGRILLVAPAGGQNADEFLKRGLELLVGPQNVTVMSAENFRGMSGVDDHDTRSRFEGFAVAVLDRVTPDFLPPLGTLSFGAVLPLTGLSSVIPSDTSSLSRRILSWDRGNPLTSSLSLDSLAIADAHRLTLPSGALPLVLADGGPVIALLPSSPASAAPGVRAADHILVSFPLEQSNWPLQPSFVMFLKNSIDLLTQSGGVEAGIWHRTDEPWVARALESSRQEVTLTDPTGNNIPLRVLSDGSVPIPALRRVGLYHSDDLVPADRQFTVNLLSETESNLLPGGPPVINRSPAALRPVSTIGAVEWWPWALAAGVLILVIEWLAYLFRARMWPAPRSR